MTDTYCARCDSEECLCGSAPWTALDQQVFTEVVVDESGAVGPRTDSEEGVLDGIARATNEDEIFDILSRTGPPKDKLTRQQMRGRLVPL